MQNSEKNIDSIQISNLSFSYEKTSVLESINLDYNQKDFLAIIGPNGGGKSTLLKLILGLLTPSSGSIKVFGKNSLDSRFQIGYVPQNTFINTNFPATVIDVVLMGRMNKNKKLFNSFNEKDYEIAHECLEQVGLKNLSSVHIGALSGGQRQRVFIARALACEAKILMLDEPTASIDPKGQIEIFELLKNLHQTKGIIIISHDVNIAYAYANKIAYVNKTLYMHEISLTTQKTLQNTIGKSLNSHFCGVEQLLANICAHNGCSC